MTFDEFKQGSMKGISVKWKPQYLTRPNTFPSQVKYFLDNNTGRMRMGKTNNDGTYN